MKEIKAIVVPEDIYFRILGGLLRAKLVFSNDVEDRKIQKGDLIEYYNGSTSKESCMCEVKDVLRFDCMNDVFRMIDISFLTGDLTTKKQSFKNSLRRSLRKRYSEEVIVATLKVVNPSQGTPQSARAQLINKLRNEIYEKGFDKFDPSTFVVWKIIDEARIFSEDLTDEQIATLCSIDDLTQKIGDAGVEYMNTHHGIFKWTKVMDKVLCEYS